jgi:hypothetical protein
MWRGQACHEVPNPYTKSYICIAFRHHDCSLGKFIETGEVFQAKEEASQGRNWMRMRSSMAKTALRSRFNLVLEGRRLQGT